ncbi:MAG: hypothetical protein AAFV93_19150 [Chloroflexota bacterium]
MTNYEEQQAQLLDAYLTALQQNPNATAPDELDSDMADFARLMVGDTASASNTIEERIWQSIQADDTPDNITAYSTNDEREPYMTKLKEKNKRTSRVRGWLPLVATAAVSVLVSLFMASILFDNRDDSARNIADTVEAQLEASPVVITATPIAPNNSSPFSTTTPIAPFAMTATQLVEEATARAIDGTQQAQGIALTDTPDSLQARATQIIQTATAEVSILTQQAQNSIQTIQPTATLPNVVQTATAEVDMLTQEANNSSTNSAQLECNFEGEFDFSINQNVIGNDDTLVITWRSYNERANIINLEIFGGFLTNDQYEIIRSYQGDYDDERISSEQPYTFERAVAGTNYQNGSYLVGIRLIFGNQRSAEILSSCALPVTFVD